MTTYFPTYERILFYGGYTLLAAYIGYRIGKFLYEGEDTNEVVDE